MQTLDNFRSSETEFNLRTVAYQTVATFAGIMDRRLWLKDGDLSNDGTLIQVPLKSDTAYQQVEHQLAHILFGTNVLARDAFCTRFATLAAKAAQRHGIEILPENIARLLYDFVVVLDSERAVGLWGQLYEGSEVLIREYLSVTFEERTNRLQTNIGAALTAHHLGFEIADPFKDLEPIFEKAFENVRLKTFSAVLLTSRWLLKKVIDREIEYKAQLPPEPGQQGPPDPDNQSDRSEALKELADSSRGQSAKETELDASKVSKYPSGTDKGEAREMADEALSASLDDEDLRDLIEESGIDMGDQLDQMRTSLSNQIVSGDEILRRKVKAKVVFRDVRPDDLMQDEEIPLSEEDLLTVERLRAQFVRMMGRRRAALADSGLQIDVEAYIQQRVSRTAQPVFRHDGRQRGFRALILLDRSQSMEGTRTRAAERACRIIQRALDFPFVEVDIWGFQSTTSGQVDIVRFHEDVSNFDSKKAAIGGVTPISQAVQIAAQRMKQGKEQKHLFVITDGFPVYMLKGGRQVGTNTLIRWTSEAIRDMRNSGVGVTGILIGQDLGAKVMNKMFGSRRDWKQVSTSTFGPELVALVTKSFTAYLRHG